jgi:5-keto 4-deoxyuronate isomerase
MHVRVRQATHPDMIRSLDTEGLRNHYLLDELFTADDIRLHYSHVERLIVGGATPARGPLTPARILFSRGASWASSTSAGPGASWWTAANMR